MLSTSTWVIILIVILIIKYVFLQPIEDKRLYKMYAARDELAIKATQGVVKQDSKEFEFVMDKVNFFIFYTKHDYNFFIIFNNIFKRPLEDRIKFEKILSKLKKNEYYYKTYCDVCYWFIRNMNLRVKFFVIVILGPINVALTILTAIIQTIEKIFSFKTKLNKILNIKLYTNSVFASYKMYEKEKPYCI